MTQFFLLIRDDARGSNWPLTPGNAGIDALPQTVAAHGGRIVDGQRYAVSGAYDEVIILDFPDGADVLGFSSALGSRGQYVEVLRVTP